MTQQILLLSAFFALLSCASFIPEERASFVKKQRPRTSDMIKDCVMELNLEGNSVKDSTESCLKIYRARQ